MRILLVSDTNPADLSFGAAQRTSMLWQALRRCGDVDVVLLAEGGRFEANATDTGLFARLTVPATPLWRRYSPRTELVDWLRHNVPGPYDLVVARYLANAAAIEGGVDAPLLVDADDAYYRYAPASRSAWSRAVAGIRGYARRRIGGRTLRRADHVFFVCTRDQRAFADVASTVLPNIAVPVSSRGSDMPREPVILFVGSLWYAPNIEAVSWFIQHCLGGIRRQVPGARFRVVGAGPEDLRRRWMATPGVDCTGFVDDLAAQYALASVTVAPLHYGGGTQIKTLESIAYGRAPIVSTFVFDGYDGEFERDRSLRVADTPDETIGACVELLTDPARAVQLAAAGHAVVAERFSEATFAAAVRAGVARTTATSP